MQAQWLEIQREGREESVEETFIYNKSPDPEWIRGFCWDWRVLLELIASDARQS